jgi:hypothetical protein
MNIINFIYKYYIFINDKLLLIANSVFFLQRKNYLKILLIEIHHHQMLIKNKINIIKEKKGIKNEKSKNEKKGKM